MGYALKATGILFDVFMNQHFGSIFNLHQRQSVSSCVMSKVMETVVQFREVIYCDICESLIGHATQGQ